MKFILTNHLVDFLISEGYTHCLSKSYVVHNENGGYAMSLIPVKEKPVFSKHKLSFVTFFHIRNDLAEIASDVENARVWVILGKEDVHKMKISFLKLVEDRCREFGKQEEKNLVKRAI